MREDLNLVSPVTPDIEQQNGFDGGIRACRLERSIGDIQLGLIGHCQHMEEFRPAREAGCLRVIVIDIDGSSSERIKWHTLEGESNLGKARYRKDPALRIEWIFNNLITPKVEAKTRWYFTNTCAVLHFNRNNNKVKFKTICF